MCVKYFWRKRKNVLLLYNYCAKHRCLRQSVCSDVNTWKPTISMRTVRTYITYFEIYFYVGLATLVRGITVQKCRMRADYVTRWLLSVLSQCRALTLDFYLFREPMIALLIMYRWGCVICLECIIKNRVTRFSKLKTGTNTRLKTFCCFRHPFSNCIKPPYLYRPLVSYSCNSSLGCETATKSQNPLA